MSVYWEFKDAVCQGIYTNVATLDAHSNTENLWLSQGQKLNENWLTQTEGDEDPSEQGTLAYIIALIPKNQGSDQPNNAGEQAIEQFIEGQGQYAAPGGGSWLSQVQDWSQQTIVQLLGILASDWDSSSSSQSSLQQNAILQMGSAIQAQMGQDTATSDSEGKTYGSMVTNDATAGQPFSNAGDDFSGVLSGFANLLTTIAA